MIGGVDRVRNALKMFQALNPTRMPTVFRIIRRPGAREPVLHAAVPSNREESSESVPSTPV